jgi:hypothetical protein
MKEETVNELLEERLRHLEMLYVAGQQALEERNRLVLEMVDGGYRQADIFRRLNEARERAGGRPLTRDAVFMLVRRGRSAQKNL